MYVYKSTVESGVANAHHIIHSALTGSRSPAGPRRLGTATRISASLSRRLSAFFGSAPGQGPKAAKYVVLIPGPGMFVNVRNGPRVVIPPPSETPPVSACKPLCAIFLRRPSVYPLSGVRANVSRLCEKLKNAMRNGWGQRCDGNFLAIFAGTLLDEKPNFTGRFFGWRRPFDFSTDKGPQSQAPAARPQSPAVRGFQRFQDRSRFARLNRKTAVKGEQDTPLVPITADFSR